MIYHQFFSIREDLIPDSIYLGFDILKERTFVKISDDIILNDMDFHHGLVAYWPHKDDARDGLRYDGVSLIKCEDILVFMRVMEKYKKRKGVLKLISICMNAMNNGEDIVHYGV